MENTILTPTLPQDGTNSRITPALAVPVHQTEAPHITPSSAPIANSEDSTLPMQHSSHIRSPFMKRHGRLLGMLAAAAIGIMLGAAVAVLPERGDLSAAAIARTDGSFLHLMLLRLIQTGVILAAEYIAGYFALGNWLVWTAPLISGLGTGLSAAYMCISGDTALLVLLLPSTVGSAALCGFGANASAEFSELLLRLVSGNKNSIVMAGSSSRAYTLRFGAYLAILLGLSIYEAVIKLIS